MTPSELLTALVENQATHDKILKDLLEKVQAIGTFGLSNKIKEAESMRVTMHEDLDKLFDSIFRMGTLATTLEAQRRRYGV